MHIYAHDDIIFGLRKDVWKWRQFGVINCRVKTDNAKTNAQEYRKQTLKNNLPLFIIYYTYETIY